MHSIARSEWLRQLDAARSGGAVSRNPVASCHGYSRTGNVVLRDEPREMLIKNSLKGRLISG